MIGAGRGLLPIELVSAEGDALHKKLMRVAGALQPELMAAGRAQIVPNRNRHCLMSMSESNGLNGVRATGSSFKAPAASVCFFHCTSGIPRRTDIYFVVPPFDALITARISVVHPGASDGG